MWGGRAGSGTSNRRHPPGNGDPVTGGRTPKRRGGWGVASSSPEGSVHRPGKAKQRAGGGKDAERGRTGRLLGEASRRGGENRAPAGFHQRYLTASAGRPRLPAPPAGARRSEGTERETPPRRCPQQVPHPRRRAKPRAAAPRPAPRPGYPRPEPARRTRLSFSPEAAVPRRPGRGGEGGGAEAGGGAARRAHRRPFPQTGPEKRTALPAPRPPPGPAAARPAPRPWPARPAPSRQRPPRNGHGTFTGPRAAIAPLRFFPTSAQRT